MYDYVIKFKRELGKEYEDKLRFQFYDQIDHRLAAIILGLGLFIFRKWRLYLTITCLNRTPAENKAVNGSKYSAHLFGRAVDVRTSDWSQEQIDAIIKYLEETWGDFIYVKYHDAGTGNHLHINITYRYRRIQFGK